MAKLNMENKFSMLIIKNNNDGVSIKQSPHFKSIFSAFIEYKLIMNIKQQDSM